jgi:hypothetical protein
MSEHSWKIKNRNKLFTYVFTPFVMRCCIELRSILFPLISLLSSMHSHFNNSTYMYILPQLTGAPEHYLCTVTPLYIVSLLLFYCCSLMTLWCRSQSLAAGSIWFFWHIHHSSLLRYKIS